MWPALWQFLRAELAVQDGRWGMTWRTAAVCALVSMVFMVYGIPLAPIACYLVLFVIKPNTAESLLMGSGVLVLVACIIPVLVWLAAISADSVVVRMLVLALGSFLFMYLSVASKVGEVGSIVALVIGFIMTLVGLAPFGELLTRAILYAALMAAAPMGVMLLFLLATGPSPAQLAQHHLLHRWQALGAVLQGHASAQSLLPALRAGNAELDKMLLFVGLFALLPRARRQQLQQLTRSSYQLMAALVALPASTAIDPAMRARWSARCAVVEQALQAQELMQEISPEPLRDLPSVLQEIENRMCSLPGQPTASMAPSPLPKAGFLNDDVRTNRSYAQFGLKVTFCALVCYLTYTALQWQDIHTAMITCYVAALGTVGDTLRKLMLRIGGCLVGATLGCASILFLMPHMSNIGQLMALVFVGCLVAAWVAQGSPRISYAGVQIGLAFLLTVLQGFGPDVSISVALDRVYGILLGNLVVFLVFTNVWPLSSFAYVSQVLQKSWVAVCGFILQPQAAVQMQAALPELLPQLQALREQLAVGQLELGVRQPPHEPVAHLQATLDAMESFYLKAAYAPGYLATPEAHREMRALELQCVPGGVSSCVL